MADFPIYRLVKGNTLTFTEMDDNIRWLSRNMSGSIVTITGSAINMSGSVSIIGDVQIAGTASIGFIKSEGYSTGSNQLGDDTSDRQTLIGTVSVSGSMRVSGSTVINNLTGSLFGTASFSTTASYVNPLNQQVIITGSLIQGLEGNIATGEYSHAEGSITKAIGGYSHAEGDNTQAKGDYSHTEGQETIASGSYSHAEGYGSISRGQSSHAEGYNTISSGSNSHAEGDSTQAIGIASHAEGANTIASGTGSHAEGFYTIASGDYQHVQGQFNISSSDVGAFIIGNGEVYNRSNLVFASGSQFQITGSLKVLGSITGSLFGTASNAVSSSYAYTASSAVSSSYPFRVTGSTIYSYNTSITIGPVGDSKTRSIIIGENAGLGNDRASDSVFIGSNAGSGSNYEESIYIGKNAGVQSVANNSVNIGDYAGYQINGGGTNRNVIIGSYTGYQASNVYYSQFIGTYSGYLATDAYYSNFIGSNAGYQATKANNSIFIGESSGYNSVSSSYSIFIGNNVGYGGSTSQGLLSTSNNNIIIGNSINLAVNSKNAINIGGLIFGSGSYAPTYFGNPYYNSSGSANGKIGINQPNPRYTLDVSGSGNYTNGLSITGSLIASNISGSLFGTASNAVSSSYTLSASYGVSSSYAYTASSAVSAYTASSSVSSSYAITASHAESLKIGLNLSASNINVTNNIVANSITAQSASFGYVQTITGSAVIIGQEYIILNTQTPSARYAGLIIYDSGSSTTTASLVWDSQTNHFVYSNNSGSSYSGGGFIAGPRNSGSLADVTYPTLNRVVRGQGGDHIYDSNIIDDDSKVSISIPLVVTGSITATTGFTGSLFGTASRAVSSSYALTSSYSTNISGTTNYIPIFTGVNSVSTSSIKQSLGSSYSSLEFPASSITGNVANYSDISVFSNESANLYLYSGPVNNKMSVNLQNAYGTITMLFQSGGFNNDLLSYEGYSTTNKTLTIGGYQGLVINQNGTGHFKSNLAITGSVTATQGFTGSLFGTASRAVSSSYALTSSYSTNISGTTNYVSKFTGVNSLGNSLVYDNGTSVMINTTSSHSSYTNPRLVVSDASNSYLEVRSVSGQSSLILSKGTSNTNTTPSVEFINSSNFGIVMYRPGVVSSNYLMYYNSDSATNRSLAFQTEGSDRLTLNQTGTVRLNSYTTDGFVKFSGSNGTLAVDTTTYQPLLNGSGYVSMSGTNVNYVSTIPNSGLTNSSITIQGSLTSLGGSVNVINGTGFVKASGTSITYDNSTYYLASNPNGYTTNTGTVTSITVSPGTGMSGGGTITTSGTVTLTNTAPDQIVALTQGGTTVITGTYPNFTITSNDQYTGTVTGTGTANYLSKFTGTSAIGNSIVYDNGTNVGIGTTSPGNLLSVAGNISLASAGFLGFTGATTLTTSNYALYGSSINTYVNVATGGSVGLNIGNNSILTITGSNVGIGTTSPNSILEISQATPIFRIQASATDQFHGIEFRQAAGFDASIKQLPVSGEFRIANGRDAIWGGFITLYTDTVERIRITSSGNVGINTSAPGYKLSIQGNAGIEASEEYFYFNSAYTVGNNSRGKIRAVGAGGGSGYGGDLRFSTRNPSNVWNEDAMTINSSGNVGIGTTYPSAKLDVSGSILANNFNSDNAVVNTADTYTSTAKITNIITLSQAEYNAIGSPSSNYLYVII